MAVTEHQHQHQHHGHSHGIGADHDHTHPHTHESVEAPYVDEGPTDGPPDALVLDIGEDVGALILFADEGCLGQEIDLTPVGACQSHDMHTMIRRRRAVGREFIAGVYPELTEGDYTVWGLDGRPLGEVSIVGGQVGEFRAGDCRSPGE
jgi:hypothetical protein